MAFLIYKVAGTLRYMGYRSAMLGPDGLYPNYRLLILAVCGALTFLLYFLHADPQIHELCANAGACDAGYCKRGSESGNPVENLDEFGEIARYMNQMERHVKGSDGDGNGKRNGPRTIW